MGKKRGKSISLYAISLQWSGKKIINAIKYSKINQQQQTYKNIDAQDVLLFLMVPNLIQAVKGLHFLQMQFG